MPPTDDHLEVGAPATRWRAGPPTSRRTSLRHDSTEWIYLPVTGPAGWQTFTYGLSVDDGDSWVTASVVSGGTASGGEIRVLSSVFDRAPGVPLDLLVRVQGAAPEAPIMRAGVLYID